MANKNNTINSQSKAKTTLFWGCCARQILLPAKQGSGKGLHYAQEPPLQKGASFPFPVITQTDMVPYFQAKEGSGLWETQGRLKM